MTKATDYNTEDPPAFPRPPTPQQIADELLRRWRLERLSVAADKSEVAPLDVLIDLLGGAEFDHEIIDPGAAARIILQHLRDAGFEIVPTTEDRS